MNLLILGASGQTGSYLAEILEKDSEHAVYSASRGPNPFFVPSNYISIDSDLSISTMSRMINEVRADVVINLISLSSVFECEKNPSLSESINRNFVEDLANAVLISQESMSKQILLFQCSSSEMYSNLQPHSLISESTELNPGTVYGVHKAKALEYLRATASSKPEFLYTSGILFNHESPRRSSNFVSKKISSSVREIAAGRLKNLELGDISVLRDWSYAPDFAQGIANLVGLRKRGEFIFASGKLHSIEEFCDLSFQFFGIRNYRDFICSNPDFVRKNNNNGLVGDSSKLRKEINWEPKVGFADLVRAMCSDLT